jgi:hexosaminidase
MKKLFQRKILFALLPLLITALGTSLNAVENHLMPQPMKLEFGQGTLAIDGSFRVSLSGYTEPRLQASAKRLIQRLSTQTGIPMHETLTREPNATLVIRCDHAGESVQSIRENESYTLEVKTTGATIAAPTPVGVLRAIETFLQLLDLNAQGFAAPVVKIADQPRFPWRGLMVDVSRRWISAGVIKRNIDAMSAVKLNVLHWHLSDDQGFRIESRQFPDLHKLGSDGNYYRQAEVRDVVAYARERGIRVVPEFDMPGHSTSWLVGYPELASAPGPFTIDRNLGVRDAAMDPTQENVYQFLDIFIGEMAELFPDDYFHIGGDEVNGKQWNANPKIRTFMRQHGMKDYHDLQTYFNQRLLRIVQKHGKKMVGWDEVLQPDLPKDIVVQSWRGQQSLAAAARQGYMGILSTGYYLDLMEPASLSYGVDPLGAEASRLSSAEQSKILGGEACIWTENIDMQNFDSANWPRTAAIAERLWSPAEVRDVDSMYRRSTWISRELEWLGLTHRTSSRMMLERLAGNADPLPLFAFDRLLTPLNCDVRRQVHPYTSLTPLNRLVDATPPESDVARDFATMVAHWQANEQPLRKQLTAWRDNRTQLNPLIQGSGLLQEASPLAEYVAALATAGLESLDYLDRGNPAPPQWVGQQRELLDEAAKPHAELLIAIVPSIAKLVDAAETRKQ